MTPPPESRRASPPQPPPGIEQSIRAAHDWCSDVEKRMVFTRMLVWKYLLGIGEIREETKLGCEFASTDPRDKQLVLVIPIHPGVGVADGNPDERKEAQDG